MVEDRKYWAFFSRLHCGSTFQKLHAYIYGSERVKIRQITQITHKVLKLFEGKSYSLDWVVIDRKWVIHRVIG